MLCKRFDKEEEVEYCINHFDISYADRDGNPIYKVTLPSGKVLKVVVRARSIDPITVITAADCSD
jgi:hypothetical protein